MASIKLTDLIDVSVLQEIQDGFAAVTGMAALTTDADGNPVTKGSNFTDFCMKYTRQSRLGCERCEKCDKNGGEQTHNTGRSVAYSCHAGLMDFAAPIIVNGEFIGSFIGGQVLTAPADENKFRKIAREIGVDENEYIAALKKVQIVPKAKVEAAAKFLHTIAKNISAMAYTNFCMNLRNSELSSDMSAANSVIAKVEEISERCIGTINEIEEKFNQLSGIAENCVSEVKATNETVKVIKDIALNTRILGFNASIEASKAKESGKGFGVIAQEVRSLADTSKSSADKIEAKMKSIGGLASRIDESTAEARKLVNASISDMEELKTVMKQLAN